MKKSCKQCRKKFVPRAAGAPQIFCSRDCKIRFHCEEKIRERRRIRETLPKGKCRKCGKMFTPRGGGKPQLYCSAPCRVKWRNDYWNPRQPRKTIKRHGTEARKQEFTEIQKQIVLGTVLGDSYINRNPSGGCRLEFTHGEGQLDWMKWKRDQLSFVFNQVKPTQCVNRKGEKFYRLASVQHHYLDDLRSVFYQRGRKIIPKSVIDNMTPLTLAVWYMDDGWYNSNPNSRQASIATNCFPIKDVRYASSVLKERFGLNSSVYIVGNQQPQLTFLRSTIDKFFDIIRPYIHPTMIYKLNHS